MGYAFLTITAVAIVLIGISFALKDRFKDLEEQIEQISLTTMQDSYQLKKKMRVLEEELLVDEMSNDLFSSQTQYEDNNDSSYQKRSTQPPLVERVLHMYKQGYTTKDISEETSLQEHDIMTTLREFSSKNN